MNDIILIGIDDTDIIGSEGTGRMARDLCDYLSGKGMGESLGVTRHQLLVDDRIPYTSHNSSLCIGLKTHVPPEEFFGPSAEFLKTRFKNGSDPGLCICRPEDITGQVITFGMEAQKEVLTKKQAIDLSAENGIFLVELGGTGGGIIGALSAIALRAEGNSGRYVDLTGIRDIEGMITVEDLLSRTDIDSVMSLDGMTLNGDEIIDSRDWIRPTLVQSRPVLRVKPRLSTHDDTAWTSVEIRERDKQAKKEIVI
jgi:hypothetical protein